MAVPGLVLASQSSWRLRLLGQIGITPDAVVGHQISEEVHKGELPTDYCRRVAIEKTQDVFNRMPDKIVLGADTVASLGRRIFTKPTCAEEAAAWLAIFSGRRHRVYTTVCIISPDQPMRVRQVETILKFKRLSQEEIDWHTNSGDWQDKAGGYGINSLAAAFVSWISGSYSSVVGLPLHETWLLLNQHVNMGHS